MTHFTILGERCSGTTFLQLAIQKNFDLKVTWKYGWKHFFGFTSYGNSANCLFISIIRHPLDWINSFYNTPHHLCSKFRGNPNAFLNDPIFSVYDSGYGKQGRDMENDYHIFKKRRYHNIFELRKVKALFQFETIPKRVKNHIFIRYEDLRDNYHETLTKIANDFNLTPKHENFVEIKTYKTSNEPFPKLSKKRFKLIDILEKIDKPTELKIGYDINSEWEKINT